ncbi:MAG: YggS family pyridoxal phosphate-dependent enzyme [Oscillospiraceae bacterium]|jgi:pyridoxal phosphate enzyme (YggS family)|nr:YggS family pyridoxal phosphate-dependent enzyme [Oscillospiraceae bacterium]
MTAISEESQIKECLLEINERIARSAARAGRAASDITLVAATKTQSAETVRAAINAGIRVCGENRVQELVEKSEQNAYSGAELHFIGSLQTNKINKLAGQVGLLQSVPSIKALRLISARAEDLTIVQDVLLEINIGAEKAKHGFLPDSLAEALEAAACLPNIRVRGLMSIPPAEQNPDRDAFWFTKCRELFEKCAAYGADNVQMKILSMGMSDSFQQAIECGSNMVRIGTSLFGKRQ